MSALVVKPDELERVAQWLCEGKIVVFPTDTVYGVACLTADVAAVERLFAAKGRGFHVALPVMVANLTQLKTVALPLPDLSALAAHFWPGPLTIVLPKTDDLPVLVTGGSATVGVRIPNHELVLALLSLVAAPLAVTSANLSGQPPATTAAEALAQLGDRVDLVVDGGPAPGGLASTVLDLTASPPTVLRPGPVSAAALAAVLGREVVSG